MKFLFGILLLALGIGAGPIMAQNQKASDKASETGMIIPAGTIMPYAGSTAPSGWVFAAGQEYNTTGTYAKLFAAIGTTYCTNDHGAGGTCTTGVFRVPDLRGRFIGGRDNMNGIAATRITSAKTIDGTVLGKAGGNQTYTPSGSIPGHYHGFTGTSMSAAGQTLGTTQSVVHENAGADRALDNSQSGSYGNVLLPGGGWTGSVAGRDAFTVNIGHSHPASSVSGNVGLASGSGGCDGNSGSACLLTGSEGNNLSPTVILNYIIKI